MSQSAKEIIAEKKMTDGYKPISIPNALKVINGRMNNQSEVVIMTEQGVNALNTMNEKANNMAALHIPVSNVQVSTDFYVNKLGFTLRRAPQTDDKGYTNALLRLGNFPTTIFLHETTDIVNIHFRNYTNTFIHAVFEINTATIEEFYKELREEGVRVGPRYDNPGCGKYFDLYDPDGHVIKVCQGWDG